MIDPEAYLPQAFHEILIRSHRRCCYAHQVIDPPADSPAVQNFGGGVNRGLEMSLVLETVTIQNDLHHDEDRAPGEGWTEPNITPFNSPSSFEYVGPRRASRRREMNAFRKLAFDIRPSACSSDRMSQARTVLSFDFMALPAELWLYV